MMTPSEQIEPLNYSRTLLDIAGDTPQPHNASVGRNPWDVLHAIGLDPHMTIGELRQRLGTDDAE